MSHQRPAPSEFKIVAVHIEPVRKDIIEREYRGFAPLTQFDYAFILLRHRLGFKVNPELLVQIESPSPPPALRGKVTHQYRGAGVEGVGGGGGDMALALEAGPEIHRFTPIFPVGIETLGRDSGKVVS